jgi:AraC-like DNA-binding protein
LRLWVKVLGMDAPPPDFRLLQVRMDMVPPRHRLDFWRDLLARKLFAVDIQPLRNETFQVEASLRMLPELTVGWGTIDASVNRRTQKIVANDNDDFFLAVNLEGRFSAEQNGRELLLKAGDALIMTCAELGSFHRPEPGKIMALRLPSKALGARMMHPYDRVLHPISRNNEALNLLVGYARALGENPQLESPQLRSMVTQHVYDLVAMALTPSAETQAIGMQGLRAARLLRAKTFICANLGRHDLDVNTVAAHERLSARQLQRLFEADGTTFSEFVLTKRLGKIRRMLTEPSTPQRSISDIALENGFGDMSHFNRAFRRRYGASPSDIRERDLHNRRASNG